MKYIFLVDDSITIRTSIQFTVKKLGWEVQEAENGSDALKKIEELKKLIEEEKKKNTLA